jgi:ATP-dependent HslUV protease ATP-binding subunit HslU
MVQAEEKEALSQKAGEAAEERLLDLLLPGGRGGEGEKSEATREKLRTMLHEGRLDDREVELETREGGTGMPVARIFTGMGLEDMEKSLSEAMSQFFPKKTQIRRLSVKEAWSVLAAEEAARLVDMDKVTAEAKARVEQHGLVFIDELDKVAGRENRSGPDVSREGVQRDLLPLVEGSTVPTKYGPVKTDHILFIAAGAFHVAKPSDLIPELQGRFPIRVELSPLTRDDFVRILTEPENALTRQYQALLATEEVELDFSPEAVEVLAELACRVNEKNENIGARRLATIMEKLLDEVSFEAPDIKPAKISVTPDYVQTRLRDLVEDTDLTRYIL